MHHQPSRHFWQMSAAALGLCAALQWPAQAASVHLANIVPAPGSVEDFTFAPNLSSGAIGLASNGFNVNQINGDPGLDIWANSGLGNGKSWYPDGGDDGYTRIKRNPGFNFEALSFFGGSGYTAAPQTMYFELLDDGVLVLSGTLDASFAGSWFGFAGGDFDEVRLRATRGNVTALDSCPPQDPGYRCNYAWLDDIRIGTAAVPEPGSAALALLALLAMRAPRQRRLAAAGHRRA